MPIYFYRWPNGDCSVVDKRTRSEAVEELAQFGHAEATCLKLIPPGLLHIHFANARSDDEDGFSISTLTPKLGEPFKGLIRRRLDETESEVGKYAALEAAPHDRARSDAE